MISVGLFDRLILNSGAVHVSFFVANDPRGSIQQLRAAQVCVTRRIRLKWLIYSGATLRRT